VVDLVLHLAEDSAPALAWAARSVEVLSEGRSFNEARCVPTDFLAFLFPKLSGIRCRIVIDNGL